MNLNNVHVPANDGRWVSERFAQLAEILRDYDPGLELCWIPPDQRTNPEDHSRAFAIVHNTPTNRYIAMHCSDRDDPQEILAKVFLGDRRRTDVMAVLEANEAAQKAFELKQELEQREELMDQANFLAKTQKNYLKHKLADGTVVKLDDQLRRIE